MLLLNSSVRGKYSHSESSHYWEEYINIDTLEVHGTDKIQQINFFGEILFWFVRCKPDRIPDWMQTWFDCCNLQLLADQSSCSPWQSNNIWYCKFSLWPTLIRHHLTVDPLHLVLLVARCILWTEDGLLVCDDLMCFCSICLLVLTKYGGSTLRTSEEVSGTSLQLKQCQFFLSLNFLFCIISAKGFRNHSKKTLKNRSGFPASLCSWRNSIMELVVIGHFMGNFIEL